MKGVAFRTLRTRDKETIQCREERLKNAAERAAAARAVETQQHRELRLQAMAQRATTSRAEETDQQRKSRLQDMALRSATSRSEETVQQRETRLHDMAVYATASREEETVQQREDRLYNQRERTVLLRTTETVEQHATRVQEMRCMARHSRTIRHINLALEAFRYDPQKNYMEHNDVTIGKMEVVCTYCQAKKFKNEAPGICCKNGKVNLSQLEPPPQALLDYMSGNTPESKHFLKFIRKYNACFQMTSFGATLVVEQAGFPSTFTVQGQIYHKAGSLLPLPEQPPKFLQLYFIGDEQMETDRRCSYISGTRRQIVQHLQQMFQEHNDLVRVFKSALDRMPSDE